MHRIFAYIIFALPAILCIVGVVVFSIDFSIAKRLTKEIKVTDIKLIKCSIFDGNLTSCNYTEENCAKYSVLFEFKPDCENKSVKMVKDVYFYAPLAGNYCLTNHTCNYKCPDVYNTVSLYPPIYPDIGINVIFICFSIIGLILTIVIFFIWRETINKVEYRSLS